MAGQNYYLQLAGEDGQILGSDDVTVIGGTKLLPPTGIHCPAQYIQLRLLCQLRFYEKAVGPDVPEDERFYRVLRLIGELGSVLRRDDVYAVDLTEASPLLRHRVYYDGRLLYCTDDTERIRFETTALRDYVDTEPLRRIKRKYVLQRFEYLGERKV